MKYNIIVNAFKQSEYHFICLSTQLKTFKYHASAIERIEFEDWNSTKIKTQLPSLKLSGSSHPPDCECTWCAGHVHPLSFPPHPACIQG